MSSSKFGSYIKERKHYKKTHISEYLYLSKYNVDTFHTKIKSIVSRARDILEIPEDEWEPTAIDNMVNEFNEILWPIKEYYCVDLTHRLYEHIDAKTRRHFEELFELLDKSEYSEMRVALDNIIEIDKIFDALYHDEINDITKKMMKIKIKKTIKKVSHKEIDNLVEKIAIVKIKK